MGSELPTERSSEESEIEEGISLGYNGESGFLFYEIKERVEKDVHDVPSFPDGKVNLLELNWCKQKIKGWVGFFSDA